MHIIAGKYKNKKIITPPGLHTRPMLSRIRKSVMEILMPHLENARFLDLFSGTGIIALEALSRGASLAISVDQNANALRAAKTNQQKICPQEKYQILEGDVLTLLPLIARQNDPFDIIGITPPYGQEYSNKTLAILDGTPALYHEDTVIFSQRDQTEEVKVEWENLELIRTKKYGRTLFEFFLPYPKK
jgi:16S rRNA (guanine966-N2)-methyltransferase